MRHPLRWLALVLLLAARSSAAASDPPESYWGPMPADSIASRVTYRPASTHPVEHAVLAPFTVVTYPIYLTTRILKKGIVFADEHGLTPTPGAPLPIRIRNVSMGPAITAGGHAGFGVGGVVLIQGGRNRERDLSLRYLSTVNGFHRGSVGFRSPWGSTSSLEIGGGYRLERNTRFFGIGPTSDRADLSYFTQEQFWGGAGYRRSLSPSLTTEWKAIYTSIETRGPRTEDAPALADVFAAALPEGYGERSAGVLYSGLLRLDRTRGTGRPEPGWITQGQVTFFGPTENDEVAFWRYTGEAGAFLPLWFTDRTLAVRGAVMWTGPTGSDVVPFTRLATSHAGENLRGYADYRWRDRGLLDLTAEYRWPVWALERPHGVGADAYAFLNSGQVFGDWAGIRTRLWRTSFGGGFRVILSRGFGGRLEVARSRESTEIRLQADQMFDFKDMGLYGGNYHVAAPN